jgi:hypothetical protein
MKLRTWADDFVWCPSQCYYYFETESGKKFCIYLRWRWSDPWTAELIQFKNDWSWDNNNTSWTPLETEREYADSELDQLKIAVMKKVVKLFRDDKIKKKGD